MTGAGYKGLREPWDSPWGQRYAFLQDPDGNRVDLFAPISEEGEASSHLPRPRAGGGGATMPRQRP